jgi:ribonucleoside-diphosphate reductase alpha chain
MVQHRPALGLWHRRPGQGHYYVDFTRQADQVQVGLRAPAAACLLHPVVGDDLVNEGGIMDLWVREARLFKYGSGTGSNFSFICAAKASPCPAAASRRA